MERLSPELEKKLEQSSKILWEKVGEYMRSIACPRCHGMGFVFILDIPSHVESPCSNCKGSGYVEN